jgi:hypothetical protein
MLASQIAALTAGPPDGVADALDVVDRFDDALGHGLARLGPDRGAALVALAGAVAVTPIGKRVEAAADAVGTGAVDPAHLTALAGARTALLGAVHDALLDRFDTAVGRTRAAGEEPAGTPLAGADNLLAGVRSWLGELAIAGWRGVDHDLVSAASPSVTALLARPDLRSLAVLLDGFADELRASSPIATMDRLPVRRWADLWTRALLRAHAATGPAAVETVTGRLLPLGVDVHEHATAVQIQVWGLLETGPDTRIVRASAVATKVDTIVGPAVWRLFRDLPILCGALAEHRAVEVTGMMLLASGDLVWQEERAAAGETADPFATARVALAGATAPATPALDRHPVRLAEPVLIEGYTVTADGDVPMLDLDGQRLAVAADRIPGCGPLTPETVASSTACIGLLRWDAGAWSVTPLAVRATVKKKPVPIHTGDWALGPTDPKVAKAEATTDAVTVLTERAGRLLRK